MPGNKESIFKQYSSVGGAHIYLLGNWNASFAFPFKRSQVLHVVGVNLNFILTVGCVQSKLGLNMSASKCNIPLLQNVVVIEWGDKCNVLHIE